MQETEFYERILGLEQPWFVEEVKLDVESGQVDVFVEHPEGTTFCCPDCGKDWYWKCIDADVGRRIEDKVSKGSAPKPAEGMGEG